MRFGKKLIVVGWACALSGLVSSARAQSLTSLLVTGGDHAYYVATNQHICRSFITSSGWVSQDLTTLANTNVLAAPGSALASLLSSDNRDYVYYFDTNGHVNQIEYSGSGTTWANQDLTAWAQTNSVAVPGSALAAFVYYGAGQFFYFDTNRHVNHLWWTGQTMAHEDLTAYTHASAPAAPGSELSTYSDANGQLHLYYIDANQHIGHLWWTGQTWQTEDLTAKSQTSARAGLGGALTGYADANGFVHVFHFDGQPHVDHVWWNNQIWQSEDLTTLSGTSAVPAPASGLSSFATASAAYVYYVDTNQHVNQLGYGWKGPVWINQDLTVASSFQLSANTLLLNPLATPQTALTSLLITGGNHVYYVDVNGHVNQIYWDGQKWVNQDLTALGNGPVVSSGIGNGAALPFVREYIYGPGQVIAIEDGQFGHVTVNTLLNGSKCTLVPQSSCPLGY